MTFKGSITRKGVVHSPSQNLLERPNVAVGRLHPRQLLQRDSGSLLKLHRESSSKRSESSKEKRSFSSHSIKCPPAGPAASSATIPGSAAVAAVPAFLADAPPPAAPPFPPLAPVLPAVRPPPPPPPPPLPEDRARLPASFNCRANQHTRHHERSPATTTVVLDTSLAQRRRLLHHRAPGKAERNVTFRYISRLTLTQHPFRLTTISRTRGSPYYVREGRPRGNIPRDVPFEVAATVNARCLRNCTCIYIHDNIFPKRFLSQERHM